MANPEPRYPAFVRKKQKKPKRGDDFQYEIDTGRAAKVLDDGRPVVLEYWHDTDTQLDLITAFYSLKDIEELSGKDHKEYLVRNGIMKPSDHIPSLIECEDANGNLMWSVSWVENYVSK